MAADERNPADTDPRAAANDADERTGRMAASAKRADRAPALLRAVRVMRELLPGDSKLGDPLSTAGDQPSQLLTRRVAEAAAERPSVSRELGLGAMQVWQALSEAQGRGRGDVELAILFTDLVDFSSWALEAGDEATLELLRKIGAATEPPITARGGSVVKRLGDGLMAVFDSAQPAVEAAHEASREVDEVDVAGYRPRLRAGVHVGRPRKLAGDYFGADVNIAARVADAASGGEVLISSTAHAQLDPDSFELRRRRFRAKGAPKDLDVWRARPAAPA